MNIILAPEFLLTMDGGRKVLRDAAVAIRDGAIVDVGAYKEVVARNPSFVARLLPNRLLMPGLINAHMHSGLLRGTAEELPVWEWLRRYIDPMHRVVTPHEAEIASRICYAEALLSGTTTTVDMWRHMDGSARVASELGNRAILVPYVGEHPKFDYFDHLDDTERLLETVHGSANGRIEVWVGLEHAFYGTEKAFERAIMLARRFSTGFHTHSNEAAVEIEEMHRRYGKRPVHALKQLGLLDAPKTLLAHCVWLDDDEIDLLGQLKVGVAHNPTSNMKLASGAAPVTKLRSAGVAVGIGTDGEKENNNLDMLEEIKFASLLGKLRDLDAAALNSWEVLGMATLEGARAIGRENDLGSIEVGKRADLIAIRTDTPRMTPLIADVGGTNLHHNVVFGAAGSDVDMTIVDGNIVVEDGRLANADIAEILEEANATGRALIARRDEWLKANPAGVATAIT